VLLKSTIYLHQSRSKSLEKLGNVASNHAVNPRHVQKLMHQLFIIFKETGPDCYIPVSSPPKSSGDLKKYLKTRSSKLYAAKGGASKSIATISKLHLHQSLLGEKN